MSMQIAILACPLLAGTSAYLGFGSWQNRHFDGQATLPTTTPAQLFFGRVIDNDGRPIGEAIVTITGDIWLPNPIMTAELIDQSKRQSWTALTDDNRNVSASIPEPFRSITINCIVRPGFLWVTDLVWMYDYKAQAADNGSFTFRGKREPKNTYVPDLQNPAIYPMQAMASTRPATMPSRGGK